MYERSWERLSELNSEIIAYLMKQLHIEVPVHFASRMNVEETDPTGRLVEICRRLGASAYLSGANGRNYLQVERFRESR